MEDGLSDRARNKQNLRQVRRHSVLNIKPEPTLTSLTKPGLFAEKLLQANSTGMTTVLTEQASGHGKQALGFLPGLFLSLKHLRHFPLL